MKAIIGTITALLILLYPFLVYLCISHGVAWGMVAILGLYILQQGFMAAKHKHFLMAFVWILIFIAVAIGAVLSKELTIKIFPVVMNTAFMLLFGITLWQKPPLIERFARITFSNIPEVLIGYCYRVTLLWVVFFGVQIIVTLLLAVFASNAIWAVYTGIISYILIAALMVGEFIYRKWRYKDIEIPSFKDSMVEIMHNYRKVFAGFVK